MIIKCPECGFERHVPDEKVPPTAKMATCPKCKHKFNFREDLPEPDFDLSEPEPATPPPPESELPDEPEPYAEPEPQAEPEARAGRSAAPEAGEEDIWNRLEEMGSGEGGQAGAQPPPPPSYGQTETGGAGYEGYEAPRRKRSAGPTAEVPWERLDRYGFFGGLLETIKRAMLNPALFFDAMPLPNGMLRPLLFAVLVVLFSVVVDFLWQMAGVTIFAPSEEMAGAEGYLPPMLGGIGMLIVLPLLAMGIFAGQFISAGILHVFLLLTKGGKSGFEATLRVTAYATAPYVLGLIPIVGSMVGWFWSLVIILVGLKHIHRTSYWQVVLAMVLPFILLVVIGIVAAVVLPPFTDVSQPSM